MIRLGYVTEQRGDKFWLTTVMMQDEEVIPLSVSGPYDTEDLASAHGDRLMQSNTERLRQQYGDDVVLLDGDPGYTPADDLDMLRTLNKLAPEEQHRYN